MTVNSNVEHFYRQNRRHQITTYGFSLIKEFGRDVYEKEFSGGGAAPGYHAVSAYNFARSQIHFRKTLREDVKAYKKRSRAAKRGWKNRKAKARGETK